MGHSRRIQSCVIIPLGSKEATPVSCLVLQNAIRAVCQVLAPTSLLSNSGLAIRQDSGYNPKRSGS